MYSQNSATVIGRSMLKTSPGLSASIRSRRSSSGVAGRSITDMRFPPEEMIPDPRQAGQGRARAPLMPEDELFGVEEGPGEVFEGGAAVARRQVAAGRLALEWGGEA